MGRREDWNWNLGGSKGWNGPLLLCHWHSRESHTATRRHVASSFLVTKLRNRYCLSTGLDDPLLSSLLTTPKVMLLVPFSTVFSILQKLADQRLDKENEKYMFTKK
jgi:hypothetical protein